MVAHNAQQMPHGDKIPKLWRQSKIIAILKPGKDPVIPKSYRPISLLCHTYKLYERMILSRVTPLLELHLMLLLYTFRDLWKEWGDSNFQHQTDTACSWLVCHSATVGGNTVQIVSTYPASPEARPPSFLGKPAVRPRSMAGGAPTPCGRH